MYGSSGALVEMGAKFVEVIHDTALNEKYAPQRVKDDWAILDKWLDLMEQSLGRIRNGPIYNLPNHGQPIY